MAKILVVDDEVEVRELVHDALSMKGHEVIPVPDAGQAVDRIFREPFDLILLDIKLTEESGLSVLGKIRGITTNLPVVIYSGAITADLEKEARRAGANEILRKDININQLVEQIEKIVKAKSRLFAGAPKRKQKSILVVDDDSEIRHVLRDFFNTRGYKVLEAESGEKAVELARSEKIQAVLLDIKMPQMDGIATLKKLLKINPRVGVVMLTASQDDENIKKALELGAYSYVIKPCDFTYLELVVMSKLAIAESD